MFLSIHSVMVHVPDFQQACDWYARLLELEPVYLLEDFPVLRVGDTEICFHKADAKVATGKAGTVTYWRVADFNQARQRAEALGGKLHRGPLEIENGEVICQIEDPFGNLFGLAGPMSKTASRTN